MQRYCPPSSLRSQAQYIAPHRKRYGVPSRCSAITALKGTNQLTCNDINHVCLSRAGGVLGSLMITFRLRRASADVRSEQYVRIVCRLTCADAHKRTGTYLSMVLSNLDQSPLNANVIVPVGPFRCLPIMISANPFCFDFSLYISSR